MTTVWINCRSCGSDNKLHHDKLTMTSIAGDRVVSFECEMCEGLQMYSDFRPSQIDLALTAGVKTFDIKEPS